MKLPSGQSVYEEDLFPFLIVPAVAAPVSVFRSRETSLRIRPLKSIPETADLDPAIL
jgi:hypothetical protein